MPNTKPEDGADFWWDAVEELAARVLKEAVSFTHDFPPEPILRSTLIRQALACADGMIEERLAE
jgi:hypothetical protein